MFHRQFTFTEFFYITVFLLFLLFLFRIINRQRNWNRRHIILSVVIGMGLTAISAVYAENGNSGMYEVKSYGFPRDFIEQLNSFDRNSEGPDEKTVFNTSNFIQNLTLYGLVVLNGINILYNRKNDNPN